jgi:hypothetical protein
MNEQLDPTGIQEADILTQYAVHARYPGWIEVIDEEEYRRVLQLAHRVVEWAQTLID